jgi:hypothetical protein
MKTLRATPGPNGWCLSLHPCSVGEAVVREGMAQALVGGREQLLAWYQEQQAMPEVWRLEIAKAAVDSGEIALGLAQSLLDRCRADPSTQHEVSGPEALLSPAAFVRHLRAGGLPVLAALPGWLERLGDFFAIAVAMLGHATLWLQAPGQLPCGARRLFALHGEVSTRTRHLLALLPSEQAPSAIVVLGRPRVSLSRLDDAWRRVAGEPLPPLVRPWSRKSLWRALPAGLALASAAPRAWRLAPWPLPWRERAAQAWRGLAGTASAQWWRDQAADCQGVVFGHTGTAEAHLLERAMQATGSRTVHAAHGLSGGMNFVAHSDVALWRCGRDAAWHQALGSYGTSMHFPAEVPPPPGGGQGTLLLSNLAHPMNPLYRFAGLAPEREVLEEAVRRMGKLQAQGRLRWRPHPVAATLSVNDRERLDEFARIHGAERLVDSVDIPAEIRAARRVLCTPSSVVVDVLLTGRAPELVGDLRWAGQLAMRGGFSDAFWRASEPDDGGVRAFAMAWENIGPARPLTLEQAYKVLS